MSQELSNLERLRGFLHELAVRRRKVANEAGFLPALRNCLNANFGVENVDISNIDEEQALLDTLRDCNVPPGVVDQLIPIIRGVARDKLYYTVTVHFPEIEISNANEFRHTIYDLYVRFFIDEIGRLVKLGDNYIYGLRSSGTKNEIASSYVHSHLQSQQWCHMRFMPFCIGHGPIKRVCEDFSQCYEERVASLFCHSLKNFVKWESLDGTPFKTIEGIGINPSARRSLPVLFPDIDVNPLWDYFISWCRALTMNEIRELLSIWTEIGKFEVSLSKRGVDFLIAHMQQDNEYRQDKYFSVETPRGQLVPVDASADFAPTVDINRTIMNFKHKSVKIKIIEHESDTITARRFLSPNVTSEFSKRLTARFNIFFIRANALRPDCPSISAESFQ